MSSAYVREVVFRDLKPANILLLNRDLLRGPPAQHRHRARPPSKALAKRFIESPNAQVRGRRARLILDLHELLQKSGTGIVTYGDWANARGLEQLDAIRQDLHRRRDELALVGARLRFSSPHVDLRGLRTLVRRELEAATLELDPLSRTEPILRSVCTNCGAGLRVAVEELMTQRSREAFVSMRELRQIHHVGHNRLKAMLEAEGLDRPRGRQPTETLHPRSLVLEARAIALSSEPQKSRAIDVARLFGCSKRTAVRFIKRARSRRK